LKRKQSQGKRGGKQILAAVFALASRIISRASEGA